MYLRYVMKVASTFKINIQFILSHCYKQMLDLIQLHSLAARLQTVDHVIQYSLSLC